MNPRVPRFPVAALLLAGSLGASMRPANACSCLVTTLDQKVAAATAVFVGDVRDVTPDPADATRAGVRLDVVTVYKGAPGPTAVVATASDGAACGVPFEEAKRYLVFASFSGTQLHADLCGGTTSDLAAATKLAPIRAAPSQRPVPRNGGGSAPLHAVPIAVAALLLAAVAVALRLAGRSARRRSPA